MVLQLPNFLISLAKCLCWLYHTMTLILNKKNIDQIINQTIASFVLHMYWSGSSINLPKETSSLLQSISITSQVLDFLYTFSSPFLERDSTLVSVYFWLDYGLGEPPWSHFSNSKFTNIFIIILRPCWKETLFVINLSYLSLKDGPWPFTQNYSNLDMWFISIHFISIERQNSQTTFAILWSSFV